MDQTVFVAIAKETGSYLIESEWDNILDEYKNHLDLTSFSSFYEGIKGHQYYNCLVLKTGGNDTEILVQLKSDYEELI